MADTQAKWKIPKGVKKITLNIDAALQQARFWQSTRLNTDQEQIDKWLAGDIGYDQLATYLDNRFSTAVGENERQQLRQSQVTAQEKEQDIQDTFYYNAVLNDNITFSEYNSYVRDRLNNEQEGSPQALTLQNRLGQVTENYRQSEELLWKAQFTNGQMSYDNYKKKLEERSGLYEPGQERYANLQMELLQTSPQYLMNEAQNKFLRLGYSDTNDTLENYLGYQAELKGIASKYQTGSPERQSVDNLVTQVGWQIVDYRTGQELNTLSTKLNASYTKMSQLQADFEAKKAIYLANPTDKNFEAWQTTYANWQSASNDFVQLQGQFDQTKSGLNDPASWFAPSWLNTVLGTETPELTSPTQVKPVSTVQKTAEQTQPRQTTTTTTTKPKTTTTTTKPTTSIPSGAIYISDPTAIPKLGEDKIYRDPNSDKVYALSTAVKWIRDPAELANIPGSQRIKLDSSNKIYQLL